MEKMQSTIATIRNKLGNLVYGSDEDTIPGVLMKLLKEKKKTIAMIDCGLGGAAWWGLHDTIHLDEDLADSATPLAGSKVGKTESMPLMELAANARTEFDSDIGVAIGAIQPASEGKQFELAIKSDDFEVSESFTYAGHSDFRHVRAVKQVLNTVRLALLGEI